jgi:heptosyltransferase III
LRILIIRPGAIGDALLTFPVLAALRKRYAHPRIALVSNANVLPLAQASGLAEEVFDFQDMRWGALFAMDGIERDTQNTSWLRERLQDIDLAICWLRDPDGVVEQNLRRAGVKRVVLAPGRPSQDERVHIVEYLARTIGLESALEIDHNQDEGARCRGEPRPYHTQNANAHRNMVGATLAVALAAVATKGLANLGTLAINAVAIHPGSGGAQKCWPIAHFAAVIRQLVQSNVPVLLLSGPAEVERLDTLLQLLAPLSRSEKLKVLSNAPLLEVAEHLQCCTCYVGNDSGITHLAAMLGIPTIVLFGPSDPTIWRPWGPCVRSLQAQPLEQLPVDVVLEAINSFHGAR